MIFMELSSSSASLTSWSGRTVLRIARHDLIDRAVEQVGAHVTAEIAVGDDADEIAVVIDDADAAEALADISAPPPTSSCRGDERHRVAGVHEVAHELQQGAEPAAGCNTPKSTAVKPRLSNSAIASASPSASCISDEVVGARLCGQASRACGSAQRDVGGLARACCRPPR